MRRRWRFLGWVWWIGAWRITPAGLPMKRVPRFLTVIAACFLSACSSHSGKVRNGVYFPPDESFELRLPEGAKRSTVTDEFRPGGSLVGFEDGDGRSWRVERFVKNGHHISRTNTDLPLVTRLLFAESAWAETTGRDGRPLLERKAVTMNDGRQAVLSVRRAAGGLRGVLLFETDSYVHLLEVLDRSPAGGGVIAVRRALVEIYDALSVHDG